MVVIAFIIFFLPNSAIFRGTYFYYYYWFGHQKNNRNRKRGRIRILIREAKKFRIWEAIKIAMALPFLNKIPWAKEYRINIAQRDLKLVI